MAPIYISELRSNWQFVAFYLIYPFVSETHRRFSRTQIMRNVEELYQLLAIRGHERKPRTPVETFQKTLQNMRDKEPPWITFIDNKGEYELSDEGYEILLRLKPSMQEIRENKEKILKKAEDKLSQWEIDPDELT